MPGLRQGPGHFLAVLVGIWDKFSPSAMPFPSWKGFSGQEQVFWSFKKSTKGFFFAPATQRSEIKLSWYVTEHWSWTESCSSSSSLQFSYFKKKSLKILWLVGFLLSQKLCCHFYWLSDSFSKVASIFQRFPRLNNSVWHPQRSRGVFQKSRWKKDQFCYWSDELDRIKIYHYS